MDTIIKENVKYKKILTQNIQEIQDTKRTTQVEVRVRKAILAQSASKPAVKSLSGNIQFLKWRSTFHSRKI